MKAVFVVESERKSEMERFVKEDETINRGSISFRDGSLFDMEGYYLLIYDGSEEAVEKIAAKYKRAEKEKEILEKVEEEEMKAAEGFGNLLF